MTEEELQAIRERAEKATPGPWKCWNAYEMRHATGDRQGEMSGDIAMARMGPETPAGAGVTSTSASTDIRMTREDALFIACARDDIPALLAEVERLQAENADLLEKNANMVEALQSASKELLEDIGPRFAKQTAENAAMREIVQALADGPADSSTYLCNYCDEYIGGIFGHTTHTPDCPVTKARQMLADK